MDKLILAYGETFFNFFFNFLLLEVLMDNLLQTGPKYKEWILHSSNQQ